MFILMHNLMQTAQYMLLCTKYLIFKLKQKLNNYGTGHQKNKYQGIHIHIQKSKVFIMEKKRLEPVTKSHIKVGFADPLALQT